MILRKVLFTLIDDKLMYEVVPLFKLFILKLWELARLFAATACVNLVFPPQKPNSNDTSTRHKGI